MALPTFLLFQFFDAIKTTNVKLESVEWTTSQPLRREGEMERVYAEYVTL